MDRSFRIGDWLVEPLHNRLVRGDARVKLDPKVMQVLLYLVQHPNEVALKEKIIESVWEGAFVTDEVLTNAIFELRKALGDDAREPRIIQTVPRKGYRLLVPVESARAESRRSSTVWVALVVVVAAAAVSSYLLRKETSDLQIRTIPLTGFAGAEEWPAISPDGDRIAFVWDRGKPGRFRSLHVQMIGGGAPLPLTDSNLHEFSPAWSPDGKEIAFLREQRLASPTGSDVLVIPALGGPERRLGAISSVDVPGAGWNPGMAWSRDGRFLAVADQESPTEPHAIFLLSLESGEKRRVTFPKDVRGDIQPAFSPDGATLAFARNPGSHGGQIFLQKLSGGDPSPLAEVEGWITDLDWTADGSAVVLVAASESEVGTRLFRVSAAGGDPERLPFGEMAHTFSISRRGNRLVHDRRSWFNTDLWRIDGPTAEARGTPTRLIASSRFDWDQEYSPDGTRIAFASERSGNNNIWVCESDGTGCRQLTDMDRAVTPRWSPDGKRLVFTRQEQGTESGLYLTDVEGGFTRRIPGTASKDCCASWSKDGRWIYFTSDRTGGPQIWRISVEGGEAWQITRNGGLNQRESPDGQFLFYAETPGLGSIRRVSIHGGEEVPVLKGHEAAALIWTLWESKIVYATADRDDPRIHLEVFDLETGESKRIFTSAENLATGMSVSPDGRWILASIRERIESDIILVEGFH